MVKSDCHSSRGPWFGSQQRRDGSQLPETPVPGDPVAFSDLYELCTCAYMHIHIK